MKLWREIEHSASPLVRELHAVWTAKRRNGGLPLRADFDPAEIRHLLANLLIADLEPEPFRVRYRLVGTRVVAASGYDFTGRYLDEIRLASNAGHWQSLYATVFADAQPLFGSAGLPTAEGGTFSYEFGIFPVTASGQALDQCLEIEDYGTFNEKLFELQQRLEPWHPEPISVRRRPDES